jgi:putative flippase GtrA
VINTDGSFFEQIKKLVIYGTNGIINTAVTYGLFLVISNVIDYRITIGIVYTIGIFISYFLNGKFVFNTRGNLGIFIIIMVLMFLTNLSITWMLVESFEIPKEISQLIAILVVFGVGFQLNKRYAFQKKVNEK